jgi:hypothetical protein
MISIIIHHICITSRPSLQGRSINWRLEGVHRQKGGIGSSSFDANQSDLRKFFGGGAN